MQRTFYFGKIPYAGDRRNNEADVTIEYVYRNGKKCFSASGNIWNRSHTNTLMSGQCIGEIAKFVNTPTFNEILRLWRLYHLNDMHPECDHQAALSWPSKAKQRILVNVYTKKAQTLRDTHKLREDIVETARCGNPVSLTDEQRLLLSLESTIVTNAFTLPENIAPYYYLKVSELRTAGSVTQAEHPNGLLCKPCPVCGYKYGSGFNYIEIPEHDDALIIRLIRTGKLEPDGQDGLMLLESGED